MIKITCNIAKLEHIYKIDIKTSFNIYMKINERYKRLHVFE